MNYCFVDTEIGRIAIAENEGMITGLFFEGEALPEQSVLQETALLQEASRQLAAWFKGELKEFSLPLAPEGTPFMKSVWQALCNIPYGKTASYKEIATAVGKPKAMRAVGMANNRNPLPVIIPCHRVIGADGSLVGYGGGLDIKVKLLELERRNS
ncbi:MAG: methylated-DNA--[protein]-cysteine S-methyltransferase [Geobacteraceae bacterium]|nr:methylated-DNA--[protein]-cysteine S-methyltransferase [Geobacteraceae bacterium]